MTLTIGVLGGVVAASGGAPLDLPRARERMVLTALALAHPDPVPVEALTHALWGPDGGGSPQTVRSYVSRLRHLLGAEHLVSVPAGYALAVPTEAVDAHRAERLIIQAGESLHAGDHEAARAAAEAALDLWRGPPYRELATDAADAARARLERRRIEGVTVLAGALLVLGRPTRAVEVLTPACTAAPLEEGLWALLIRALHAAGRRDEGLRRHDELRRALSAELGIEPGQQVREAHAALLRDQPAEPSADGDRLAIHQGYAERDGRALAYLILDGGGPPLLFLHGMFLPSEMLLEEPSARSFLHRLAAGRRLILLDMGGIGLSDAVDDAQLDYGGWAEDTLAVLQAVAVPRTDVLAMGFGLGPALHLAVTHADRVGRLVIGNSPAAPARSGLRLEDALAQVDAGPAGQGGSVRFLAPSRTGDEEFSAWLDRAARRGARPSTARAFYRMMFTTDVLTLAEQVRQEVLVVERRDAVGGGAEAEALVEALPGAAHVVLGGADALPFVGDVDALLAPVEAFLAGAPMARHGRLMAVAVTAPVGGAVVVSTHELPEQALAAAAARVEAAPAACRAVVDAGVVWSGSAPGGPAVERARQAVAAAPLGFVTRTAAFDAVSQDPAVPPGSGAG